MSSEAAKVEVHVQGDEHIFWTVVYVNGFEMRNRMRVESIQAGENISGPIRNIAEDAYRLGYRQGFANSQKIIREAIGVEK